MTGDVYSLAIDENHIIGVLISETDTKSKIIEIKNFKPFDESIPSIVILNREVVPFYKASIVMCRTFWVDSKLLKKKVDSLSEREMKVIFSKVPSKEYISKLHKRLHVLKRKMELSKLNNESAIEFEQKLENVIRELGFDNEKTQYKKGEYTQYREVPSKGYISIFRG